MVSFEAGICKATAGGISCWSTGCRDSLAIFNKEEAGADEAAKTRFDSLNGSRDKDQLFLGVQVASPLDLGLHKPES